MVWPNICLSVWKCPSLGFCVYLCLFYRKLPQCIWICFFVSQVCLGYGSGSFRIVLLPVWVLSAHLYSQPPALVVVGSLLVITLTCFRGTSMTPGTSPSFSVGRDGSLSLNVCVLVGVYVSGYAGMSSPL